MGERFPLFYADRGVDKAPEAAGPQTAWPTAPGDTHVVLLWAAGDRGTGWRETVAAVRAALPADVPAMDVSGWPALGGALGAQPVAVLVRPDGHIAAIEPGADPDRIAAAVRAAGVLGAANATGLSASGVGASGASVTGAGDGDDRPIGPVTTDDGFSSVPDSVPSLVPSPTR